MKHKTYNTLQAPCFKFQEEGFTLLELLVVIFITATLAGMVTVNFRQQRIQQEVQAAGQEMVSRIREVQNTALAGSEVQPGVAPDAYDLDFTRNSSNYNLFYVIDSARTQLETVSLTQNMSVSQIRIDGSPSAAVTIQMSLPFGQILADSSPNRTVEIDLSHTAGDKVTVLIDGISGRIGIK